MFERFRLMKVSTEIIEDPAREGSLDALVYLLEILSLTFPGIKPSPNQES